MFSFIINRIINMSWDPLFSSLPLVFGTIISGILLHILVYRHNEWDSKAPYLIFSYLSTALTGILFAPISSIAILGSCPLVGFFGIILAYSLLSSPGSLSRPIHGSYLKPVRDVAVRQESASV